MNTDDISGFLDSMTLESEKELERVRMEGEERKRRFTEEAGHELSAYIDSLREEEELFAKKIIAMERNRWSLEFKRLKLREYENYLEERIADAVEFFRKEERERYTQWMMEVFREILDDAGTGPLEVTLNPGDRDMGEILKEEYIHRGGQVNKISIRGNSPMGHGGMRVRCIDRPLAYDATVERMLSRGMDDIRLAVRDCLDRAGKNPDAAGGGTGGK